AQELGAATLTCDAKARAFAAGALAEVLHGCDTPLHAEGRAYRSLAATWGPDATHDVRWTLPDGGSARCFKAPNWCFDTGDGPAGDWKLEVPLYATLHPPSPFVPVGLDGYSGLFGVFAGRP
ncbi:MAG: hypothetical protein LC624_07220, partial [Halobacteriales archaeon]|nr:hypothetical protein [Halobacteriales archaeon]